MKISYINYNKLDCYFPAKERLIEVNPGRVILPKKFIELSESILNFPVYEDDIWLCSYPRTGSTWAQEMIWLLGNNLDFEKAKEIQLLRSPVLELTALFSADHYDWLESSIGDTVEVVRNMPRPRCIRSHLPWSLLPKQLNKIKPKIIYTGRNPKDVCVSFYYHCKNLHRMEDCKFEDFCELFLCDDLPLGSYWNHILPFWEKRDDENILFVKYEDMKQNLPQVVEKCAKFLNVNYDLTEENMEKICKHLQFDTMQNNPAVNAYSIIENTPDCVNNNSENCKFIRKGQIGDWKNYLSEKFSEKFDDWIESNTQGTDLKFVYE